MTFARITINEQWFVLIIDKRQLCSCLCALEIFTNTYTQQNFTQAARHRRAPSSSGIEREIAISELWTHRQTSPYFVACSLSVFLLSILFRYNDFLLGCDLETWFSCNTRSNSSLYDLSRFTSTNDVHLCCIIFSKLYQQMMYIGPVRFLWNLRINFWIKMSCFSNC